MDRNSRPNFAAFSAEEERRRANEEARGRRDDAEDVEGARTGGDRRPHRTSKIFDRIRRAFGR